MRSQDVASTGQVIVVGLVSIPGLELLSAAGVWTGSWAVTLGLLVAGGLAAFFWGTMKAGLAGMAAALVALAGGGLSAAALRDSFFYQGKTLVEEASLFELAEHPLAAGFTFTDVRVELTLRWLHKSEYSNNKSTLISFTEVAPVVPAGWSRREPVPAWAVCLADGCTRTWKEPWRGALVHADPEGFRPAIAAAEQAHGLHSAPGAPLLTWVEDPYQEIARRHLLSAGALVVPPVLWLVIFLMVRGLRGRRNGS